jgi:hypothetical protein
MRAAFAAHLIVYFIIIVAFCQHVALVMHSSASSDYVFVFLSSIL